MSPEPGAKTIIVLTLWEPAILPIWGQIETTYFFFCQDYCNKTLNTLNILLHYGSSHFTPHNHAHSYSRTAESQFPRPRPQKALRLGRTRLTIIDVRNSGAFNTSHIAGALPIPLSQVVEQTLVNLKLELVRDIYIYGSSDEETALAAAGTQGSWLSH